ncbi:AP2-like ethylene-responsive transcription factor BBM [Hibiscus syriacus]|uniref:AP2-like ethylene-responsive transcription factor BBM n=1 Tax=Hibiscus syriacus TaxID=106335 RepID=A0A6A2Y117_HIBSY|nr:AP2-like ethylene-responsive transcription factor BBM [Hibiscus syriacus]
MELMMVNDEQYLGQGRRRRYSINSENVQVEAVRCVKRRRRDPVALIDIDNQDSHRRQYDQGNAAASAATVKRSSRFRGVSRHRWTSRYEAHLWDKLSWNVTQKKKGKQDDEEAAARAYDLAALKYWGTSTFTNFPISGYEKEIEIMQTLTKEEYLASLRRKSSGFSRGVSKYRGVARHHNNGRWEARIGRVFGNKYFYLGTYSTQEEAARANDIAAIEYRGMNAVTNFDLSNYIRWLKPNESLPIAAEPEPVMLPSQCSTPRVEYKPSFNHLFAADYLNSSPNKEFLESSRIHVMNSNNKCSSTTALGLLLRSSLFRELVEKNIANMAEAESGSTDEDDEHKNKELAGTDDELSRLFYDGIATELQV